MRFKPTCFLNPRVFRSHVCQNSRAFKIYLCHQSSCVINTRTFRNTCVENSFVSRSYVPFEFICVLVPRCIKACVRPKLTGVSKLREFEPDKRSECTVVPKSRAFIFHVRPKLTCVLVLRAFRTYMRSRITRFVVSLAFWNHVYSELMCFRKSRVPQNHLDFSIHVCSDDLISRVF